MRALNTNFDGSSMEFYSNPGVLSNDFFVNLLDMNTQWKAASNDNELYEGVDRKTGEKNGRLPVQILFSVQILN
jgi:catalase-peroxidase